MPGWPPAPATRRYIDARPRGGYTEAVNRLLLLGLLLAAAPLARAEDDEEPPPSAEHETSAEAPQPATAAPGGAGIRTSARDSAPGSRASAGQSSGGGGGAGASSSGASSPSVASAAAIAKAAPKGCQIRPAYTRCGSSVANCPVYSQEPGVPVAYKVPASYFSMGPNDIGRVVIHHTGGGKMLVATTNNPCAFTCGGEHTGTLAVLPADTRKDARWRKEHPEHCQIGKGDVYVNILFTSACPLKGGCSYMIWQ